MTSDHLVVAKRVVGLPARRLPYETIGRWWVTCRCLCPRRFSFSTTILAAFWAVGTPAVWRRLLPSGWTIPVTPGTAGSMVPPTGASSAGGCGWSFGHLSRFGLVDHGRPLAGRRSSRPASWTGLPREEPRITRQPANSQRTRQNCRRPTASWRKNWPMMEKPPLRV